MTIKTKLFCYFISISCLILLVGVFTYSQLQQLKDPLQNRIPQLIKQVEASLKQDSNVNLLSKANAVVSYVTYKLQKTIFILVVMIASLIGISILLGIIASLTIIRPIKLLHKEIERINLESINTPISKTLLHFSGEMGALAKAFIAMIYKLRTTTVLQDELLSEMAKHEKFENELRELATRLKESNSDLDQFAYVASHDLRAPLRGIANLAQWIEEDCQSKLPPDSREHLELLKNRVRRLDALISGILDYSRVGRVNTATEEVNMNTIISEVVDSLAPAPNVKIIIDNRLPTVVANRFTITQVFLNLLSNAIKYSDKAQAHINIGSKELKNYYQLYVMDDGPGIDPHFHQKIFIIFQALQSRDTVESTGIGLSVVKKIIETQGGKIWLTSAPGKGATFYFTWPKDVSHAA